MYNAQTLRVAQSLRQSVLEPAQKGSQEMLEMVPLEQMRRQMDKERADRDRRDAETAASHAQLEAGLMARIAQLEEQLAETEAHLAATEAEHEQIKAELDQERQLRIVEETERREAERAEDRQRAEDVSLQLSELTSIVAETREQLSRRWDISDERRAAKAEWQAQKDQDIAEIKDMLANLQQAFADTNRRRDEKAAEADSSKPNIETVSQEPRSENADATLRKLFHELAEGLRAENQRNLEEILGAVRYIAPQQTHKV